MRIIDVESVDDIVNIIGTVKRIFLNGRDITPKNCKGYIPDEMIVDGVCFKTKNLIAPSKKPTSFKAKDGNLKPKKDVKITE